MTNRGYVSGSDKPATRQWIMQFALASYGIHLSSAEAELISASLSHLRELRNNARAIEANLESGRPLGSQGFQGEEQSGRKSLIPYAE
jgi:hypothetical protein